MYSLEWRTRLAQVSKYMRAQARPHLTLVQGSLEYELNKQILNHVMIRILTPYIDSYLNHLMHYFHLDYRGRKVELLERNSCITSHELL